VTLPTTGHCHVSCRISYLAPPLLSARTIASPYAAGNAVLLRAQRRTGAAPAYLASATARLLALYSWAYYLHTPHFIYAAAAITTFPAFGPTTCLLPFRRPTATTHLAHRARPAYTHTPRHTYTTPLPAAHHHPMPPPPHPAHHTHHLLPYPMPWDWADSFLLARAWDCVYRFSMYLWDILWPHLARWAFSSNNRNAQNNARRLLAGRALGAYRATETTVYGV